MIDLHTHSTFSDGTSTPEQLVDAACALGLKALALTDHDTLHGIERFLAACEACGDRAPAGFVGIAGVELSAEVPRGTMHLLGYGIDPAHAELAETLAKLREGRGARNREIHDRLSTLGAEVTHEEVAACAGDHVVGRPHFAQALVKKGHVATKEEAFKRLLAKGAPAYVPRFRLEPRRCIQLIRAAGGVAVLAHPFALDRRPGKLRNYLQTLKAYGLRGLEAYYSEHDTEKQQVCIDLADALGLLKTGGSDFHGAMNPDLHIGRGFGPLKVPDGLLAPLMAAFDADGAVRGGEKGGVDES